MLSTVNKLFLRRRRVDDERLLRLFWKRAELKQEFGKLRREHERLAALLRQQEGTILRSDQRLEHLENYLADPHCAANATLYYQLRGLWQFSRRRLVRLARELETRQHEAETSHDRSRFEERRRVALSAIHENMDRLRDRQAVLDREGEALQVRWQRARGFWNCLRRRRLEADIERVQEAIDNIAAQMERYERAAAEKRCEQAPAAVPLSLEGRRLVNISVIALAQQMLLHFNEHGMSTMAREAALRNVVDAKYGTIDECRMWSQRIEAARRRFEEVDLTRSLKQRARFLQRECEFRRQNDTVPLSGALDGIPFALTDDEAPRPGDARSLPINVLADDYWEICSVLLT